MHPLYAHQEEMAQFGLEHALVFNTSDPGTGKTRGSLEAYVRRKTQLQDVGRLLVVAPLSILKSAWGDDITEFTDLTYSIAHGSELKRRKAFNEPTDIVIINHDGIKWLARNLDLCDGFTDLIIDEVTAYKNPTAQRSKASRSVARRFDHITTLTGTPNPNSITDLWHPVFIMDNGERLGNRFYKFRQQVCFPEQVGPQPQHVKWVDKPGASDVVSEALEDINIRFRFEDCLDIPEHTTSFMQVDMPPAVMKAYKDMEEESVIDTKKGSVKAIHAGIRVQKMLQILSGAVYDQEGDIHPIHNDRYALVMQLVMERDHSVVAFNWKHQKEALIELATKLGVTHAVIDGSVSATMRTQVVEDYQAGKLQTLFCHPQSAGHGLTFTRGRASIWCSPTYNAEHFQQFNRRIYRAGQDKRTETICIAARDTAEVEVYEKLNTKLSRMDDLLGLLTG
jgi:SNF2 family DNA or RNA helicase